MSCYHPLKAFRTPTGVVFHELSRHDIIGRIDLPCGQCIGCRMRRASDWELRVMHEASLHDASCFVTLTYGPGNLPPNASLEYRDFQLFMKRVRKLFGPVRFYMCGEYGPLNLRPHYHAVLFGVDFRSDRVMAGKSASGAVFFESRQLSDLWGLGKCTVQDLVRETASYCARYIMKKVLGVASEKAYERVLDSGEIVNVMPEFARMSLKPGIGAGWYERYRRDVFPHDFVVTSDGKERSVPKYYDKLLKRADFDTRESVGWKREAEARKHVADQTPARLRVREVVHEARVSTLKRGLE